MNPLKPTGARPGPAFTVTFDGRPVEALPGQTVAAVLWAAGVTSWRTTRGGGRPRGVFCGIGVCFDCLVTVNGRPGQRACLVPARPGDAIGTQHGTGHEARGGEGAGGEDCGCDRVGREMSGREGVAGGGRRHAGTGDEGAARAD